MDFRADGNADGMEQLISETIDKYAKNGIPLTRQEAMDEIAADYAANELMTDPESIQAFVNSKPKAARSFWQKLRNAFKQLRKKIDGTSAAEKKILRRMSTAERLWADAFQAASERANGAQQTSGKSAKNKARKPETTKSLTEKSRKNTRYAVKKELSHAEQQFNIIQSSNPMHDDVHTGIRSANEIMTFQEVIDDWGYGDDITPDFTWPMVEDALESGKITVYSSYPIEQGVFVSPSLRIARDYAGSGHIYERTVLLADVAWIDATEGQYASVEKNGTKYSVKKKTADSGSLYDYTKSFAQQIDDWIAGRFPKGDALVLGDTPEVLQKIGLDNLPLTINQKHIDYAINGTKNAEHTIGMDMLKQLPEALKEPIAVIASETHPDTSVIALLSLVHQGHQIIAPIYINGKSRQNGAIINTNLAASVHGRRNAITRLLANAVEKESNGNTAIFYWNKEKATALLQQARDTMPKSTALMPQVRTASAAAANISDGYIHSIYDEGSPVKARYSIMKSRGAQSYESEIERLKKQREYISKFPTHIHDKKPTESNQSAFNVLLCISNDHSRCNGWCNTSY